MGNAFYAVRNAVGKIVHRIDAPLIAGALMRCFFDAINNGVAQVHIGRSHINKGAKSASTFVKFAVFHAFE